MTPEQTTDSKTEYAKYVKSVLADQEHYDRQQRLSETGFCIPPITIRRELISEHEFIIQTTDSKEPADYRCNACGDVFTEIFTGEKPHDFYPCPLCDEGEGKKIGLCHE